MNEDYLILDIPGAGRIRISKSTTWTTARTTGFVFETDWDYDGRFSGGVLGLDDAEKLAHHILRQIRKQKLINLSNV